MTKISNAGVPQPPNAPGISTAVVPPMTGEPAAATAAATGISAVQGDEAALALKVSAKQILAQTGLNFELTAAENAYVSNLPTAQREQLSSVTSAFSATVAGVASAQPGKQPNPSQGVLQERWSNFVSDVNQRGGAVDVNALVQWVLRESYLETTKDLYFYAEKVKFYNEAKKGIREDLQRAREKLVDYAGKEETEPLDGAFVPQAPNTEFTGSTELVPDEHQPCTTKGELETYIENAEERLTSLGDDSQLANVDLQNILQKQQQTIQMMSNIAKMLHDTALAVIRKMSG